MKPIMLVKLMGRWSLTYLWLLTSSLSINAVAQSPNGTTVAGGNGAGSAANQLNRPSEVHVDRVGNIYIADYDNHRVQKWAPGATSGTTVAGGNGEGSGANQLANPSGVYVDGSGNIYIADKNNNRVQKWAPGATSGTTVAGSDSYAGANQLVRPSDVYVDGSGNVYVINLGYGNHRVQKWAPGATSGTTVAGDGYGSGANQLANPTSVYVDGIGNVYVADSDNNRVQKWAPGATSGTTVAGGNGRGAAPNQLSSPFGVDVDGIGNIYVADWDNHRIQRWAPGATSGTTVAGGNGRGAAPNQLSDPFGVFVDGAGKLFVADWDNHRIQQFPPLLPPTLTGLSASPNPVCVGQPIGFTATVGTATTSYNYTLTNGAGSALQGTASATTFSQSLTAVGSGLQTYTLTVSTSVGTASASVSVQVNARPNAGFSGLASVYCANAGAVTLIPGTPGGSFSGPGVSGTTFTPASAGSGGSITYSITQNACQNTSSQTVTVNPVSAEYQALADLYTSTNGPNWTNKTNWLTGCTPCDWQGVGCTNGRVTSLSLMDNQLSGTIPTSLSALTNLGFLYLSNNQLSGPIPAGLSALTNLQDIRLNNNRLSGSIPFRLSSLRNLRVLYLNNNQLSGPIPTNLSALTNLQYLVLDHNQLNGTIPTSLSRLTNLLVLVLNSNQLSGTIPTSLSAITGLQSLWLQDNQLSGPIPEGLSALTNLQYLLLQNNQLSGCLPASLTAQCRSTVEVTLSGNAGLPNGGDFTAFCTSGLGSDAFAPVALASLNPACVGNVVSLSVSAGTAYAWSGPDGFTAPQQTPSLSLTNVSQGGVYSVTVSNGGGTCSATTALSLTVNAPPPAPTLLTSAITTVGQPISVTASGCSGTLDWTLLSGTGTTNGSIYTLTNPGNYTLSATCSLNGCTSASSSSLVLRIDPVGPLQLLPPTYDCSSGAITFNTYSGNGSPIEYFAIGITGWTTNPNQFVDTQLRTSADAGPLTIYARQSGQQTSISFDLRAQCQASDNQAPFFNGPLASQTTGQGGTFSLNLSGTFTDPEGQTLSLSATGLPAGLSVLGMTIRGMPTQAGSFTAILIATDPGGLSAQGVLELTVQANTGSPLQLLAPDYECASGAFTFRTTGGDGSPVEYFAIGITGWTTNPNQYVDEGLRTASDAGPLTLYARQSGQQVSINFNLRAHCGLGSARRGASEPVLRVKVLGNPVVGQQVEFVVTGAEGQPLYVGLVDTNGQVVTDRQIGSAQTRQAVVLKTGSRGAGTLLLRVSTPTQSQTLRVLKID